MARLVYISLWLLPNLQQSLGSGADELTSTALSTGARLHGAVTSALASTAAAAETAANEALDSDFACNMVEKGLQELYHQVCNTEKPVTCVYGTVSKCNASNICTSDEHCGFVVDNNFVKFPSYKCDLDIHGGHVDGTVTCVPTFTPTAVGSVIAATIFALLCCCCVCRCLCCKRAQQETRREVVVVPVTQLRQQ
eukprot:gnl/TRDRNA2_/TRDRNA2_129656_c0_seq1.p1 gnl/TRDRNA2_/TRDRNA2_129656_c0~~gnl/TRDRNA2_/TRDRNA2_129656_c0_seq1.p1  ORF type:complete len:195 (-),score=39.83 gnl/TRDRNA2_/TRDRNA2_129656_c0_seq1:114-698(-)